MNCCCMPTDPRRFFVLGVRLCFGVWLLYGGLVKWVVFGPTEFVAMITGEFDKTWSPHGLNVLLAYVIMVAEPVLSMWLLTGWRQRLAWTLMAALMFMLTFGQTMLMKSDVSANWQYLVLTLVCAALCDPDPACAKTAPPSTNKATP